MWDGLFVFTSQRLIYFVHSLKGDKGNTSYNIFGVTFFSKGLRLSANYR